MQPQVNQPQAENPSQRVVDELMQVFTDNEEKLCYLRCRWEDEKEYENFDDYREVIRPIFEAKGFRVLKISPRFCVDVAKEKMAFELRIGLSRVSAKRIA